MSEINEILVGIDESEQSTAAVLWAAEEAGRRGATLRIVNVAGPWLEWESSDARVLEAREWLARGGQNALERVAAAARERVPGLEVVTEQAPGQPAGVLVERGANALMTVVGSHGVGRLAGALVGSVAFQVVTHARGPAVVVQHHGGAAYGEVAVAVDGSEVAAAAIDFAFEAASLRGARLRAVLAWEEPMPLGGAALGPIIYEAYEDGSVQERELAEALAGRRERYPDVEVVAEVVPGRPVRVLTGVSARADLLVLGSRGRGGFKGLLLGSVGQAMVNRSHCPLAIVHPPQN
ncbi:universal stress protein [Actinomadura flavalba]|uniref:universal stress protein n=1 Tax=Actinomadura flavalba TaxID=1120938 RepID=UPI00037E58B1|nr:universal stress protein [Actinomadura flavalba]